LSHIFFTEALTFISLSPLSLCLFPIYQQEKAIKNKYFTFSFYQLFIK
jgi:hypothetical protein